LDSIIFLTTRSQPNTKIHSLSTDPTTLRDMLTREYKFRRSQGAPEVVDCIMECGDNHELIINKAVAEGFIKLNIDQFKMGRVGAIIPRGREFVPQTDPTRNCDKQKWPRSRPDTREKPRSWSTRLCSCSA